MRRLRLAAVMLIMAMLVGCRSLVTDSKGSIRVYATFYPIYALTEGLMAGIPDATLRCLVQPQDGCLRRYQLSDWDAYTLASADAVIAGGRGLESFEGLLFSLGEKGPAVSAVLYDLELYNGAAAGDREDSHLEGPNPHLYMSISGARQIVESISATLMALDPRYAAQYGDNEAHCVEALDALEQRVHALADDLEGKSVILMNEALIYVARDYGLETAAWIDRESGEAFYGKQLTDCLESLKTSGARVVLIERQAPASLVSALREAGFSVALVDILSTHREGEGFESYIEAQNNNAAAIGAAFKEIA